MALSNITADLILHIPAFLGQGKYIVQVYIVRRTLMWQIDDMKMYDIYKTICSYVCTIQQRKVS